MVRGYQRRVVHLKNTGSESFEEAFFLVRESESHTLSERELLREANRIVEESTDALTKRKRCSTFLTHPIYSLSLVLLGGAISSIIWILSTIV